MKISTRILLALLSISLLPLGNVIAQDVAAIRLKQEQVAYVPKSFYISETTDSLGDSIGTITDGAKKQKLTLQGGAGASFKNFIDHNVKQDKSAQGVVLNITKIDIDIKKKGTVWAVSASMAVSFYAGGIKLVQYTGKGKAEMDSDPRDYAERFIRQTIEQNMSRFDGWWAEHKNGIAVSPVVKVNVTIGKTINKPDCIVYSLQRPLEIRDFTGPVQNDVVELATTYSGFIFSTTSETRNGQLEMNVLITPYFEKTKSWFKQAGKTPVLLAHEQAHFDITAIKTCELADAIRKANFTKDNYIALFGQLRKQYNDESNEEQNTYDTETRHGTIPDVQQAWQKRISLKVKAIGCY